VSSTNQLSASAWRPGRYHNGSTVGSLRFAAVCVETRHMHAALSARINKTDRNDARGIAQMMRVGLFKAVHVKTPASQHRRLLLTSRKLLQRKIYDTENDLRGSLRNFGLKVGVVGSVKFEETAPTAPIKPPSSISAPRPVRSHTSRCIPLAHPRDAPEPLACFVRAMLSNDPPLDRSNHRLQCLKPRRQHNFVAFSRAAARSPWKTNSRKARLIP
jgi:hypothetical protein